MDSPPKPIAPPGLQKLIEQCLKIYPDQPNPLQVTTVIKYWLGGQDPLDYISMYYNPGNVNLNIPPHWHYISFGLSDLHGDGRVHQPEPKIDDELRSGMGFELSFRLAKHNNDSVVTPKPGVPERPPTWPANLLQALARYVFTTGNRLCAGDNVPWRKSLDNSNSKIQHMLITNDPQMQRVQTPFGWVDICQIVGVTEMELEQASRWNGNGVINLLKKDSSTGGEWLITNMNRGQSVFELFPETLRQLEHDLENEGSDLAGVNAEFTLHEVPKVQVKTEIDINLAQQCHNLALDEHVSNQSIKSETDHTESVDKFPTTMSVGNSLSMCCPLDYQPMQSQVISLDGLHLTLAPYAAKFLMLAIKDRIRHGRHFTFKCQNRALTFVSEAVSGAVVSRKAPYGVLGYWIQILITDDLIPEMIDTFKNLTFNPDKIEIPQVFEWTDKNLKITIDNVTDPQVIQV